jgi:hypothetical protein
MTWWNVALTIARPGTGDGMIAVTAPVQRCTGPQFQSLEEFDGHEPDRPVAGVLEVVDQRLVPRVL